MNLISFASYKKFGKEFCNHFDRFLPVLMEKHLARVSFYVVLVQFNLSYQ